MNRHRFVLASASPRRLRLLRGIGLDPLVLPVQVEERAVPNEAPRTMVLRLAEKKGRAAARRLTDADAPCVILAADTAVVLGRRILGKPASAAEARAMLRLLRGRTHEVLTGVFILRTDDERTVREVECSHVRFRGYDEAAIRDYVAGGEPLDKAGAYAIQGGGARLAEGLEGSWSNVVGLPVEKLEAWLSRIGLNRSDLALESESAGRPGQPFDSANSS